MCKGFCVDSRLCCWYLAHYWKIRADQTHDLKYIVFAYKEVIRTDYFFTLPGGAMILGGGCGMVWVRSFVLLMTAGMIWAIVLAPTQRKMLRLAVEGLETRRLDARLIRLSRIWYLVGSGATTLPLIAGFLMITQPV